MNAPKLFTAAAIFALATPVLAAPRDADGQPAPKKSGFYDFFDLGADFSPGVGTVSSTSCTVGAATQPAIYAGNMLLDCDGEVPHNETTIAADPKDAAHAIGGYHSYHRSLVGSTVVQRVIATVSVTRDGGTTWREVTPPVTPYQFTGDPGLAFAGNGRIYFSNIADHEGPGGAFTSPSVVVASSDDGGSTWTNPVTVAPGHGAIAGQTSNTVFQDKSFLATDPSSSRVHVTWTSFQDRKNPFFSRSPIMTSRSDDGASWSPGMEISGFGPFCSATISGQPDECDLDQDSYPTVAPNGRVYVSFENFNTPAENQILVVSSADGGKTFSSPARVDTVFDINYPLNVDRRQTLTGCQLRVSSVANSAADPSDPTGKTVYVVWSDNRNGSAKATNTDVFLARSTDGGQSWKRYVVDGSPNDQFFPWVAVAGDGGVDVGYMDRFPSAGQGECKYGFTLTRLSFDTAGHMALLSRQEVDTGLSDPGHSRWFSATTNGNGRFVGDYNGVAIGSDGSTWSSWTDQRNVVANPPSPTRTHGQHAVGARTETPK
jgi:hypothetical protein